MFYRLRRSAPLFLGALLLLAAGCIFSPERKPPTTIRQTPYLAPTSPSNVLQNLVTAYVRRDSAETALVYDANYSGSSTDLSGVLPKSSFTQADEIRHVGALKLSTNIVGVTLDLGDYRIWVRQPGDASDPPGYAIINIPASKVSIDDVGLNKLWESTNRVIQYTFKPTVATPGDTTWTVITWTEIAN